MFIRQKPSIVPDSELLLHYRSSGDVQILGELFTRYTSLMYGVCLKYLKDRDDSKDAVMQVFEKLVQTLREHEIENFKSWLYVTTRNHCLMQLRAKKGKMTEELSPYLMETDPFFHLEEETELEWNLSKLEKCMEQLVVEQKRCVQLFYMEQKCYKDITGLTDFNLNQVKSFIQNGKRNLKSCMERNG
ncbi:MAG: sigma-70 family RNA polymerase sigma factor [Bacteroidia bacterium]|nr:sigma-70 family RNA polymerase sigma factor [Bacteroidia bacterium]